MENKAVEKVVMEITETIAMKEEEIDSRVMKQRRYILLTPIDIETLKGEGFEVTLKVKERSYGLLDYEASFSPIVVEEGGDGDMYVTALIDDEECQAIEILRVLFNKFEDLMAIGDDNPVYVEYKTAERRLLNACEKTRRAIMA